MRNDCNLQQISQINKNLKNERKISKNLSRRGENTKQNTSERMEEELNDAGEENFKLITHKHVCIQSSKQKILMHTIYKLLIIPILP